MSFIRSLMIFACVLGLPGLSTAREDAPPHHWGEAVVVQTTGGKVAGFLRNGALEFRGIPYGASVAGGNRWTMPVEAEPWDGILPAMHFGGACAQAARYGLTERSDNEDCLSLNVSLPDTTGDLAARKRPVIVWIHGGAFVGGSSSLYRLDRLAKAADAVVVTMNYRVGVFGFMPHPAFDAERNGGFALEDQRLALRWVQANIAAFGGDADNVTLAGESAGAASVCFHLIAPEQTSGLFHKAIVQSGACVFRLRSVDERMAFGTAVAQEAGCADPATALQCLRNLDPQVLIAAGDRIGADDLMAFAPPYGTTTLPRQGLDALDSGQFVRVPVLNGGTRDELRLYVGYDVQAGASFTADNYAQTLETLYGENAADVGERYPVEAYPSAPIALATAMTDFRPDIGINQCLYLESARLMSRHVPVFQWQFADRGVPVLGVAMPVKPDPGFELGAAHSSELNVLFPNFSNTTAISGPDLSRVSQALGDQILQSWVNFVHSGNPASDGLPVWEPYAKGGMAIRFEPGQVRPFDARADHNCAFWQALYPDHFAR